MELEIVTEARAGGLQREIEGCEDRSAEGETDFVSCREFSFWIRKTRWTGDFSPPWRGWVGFWGESRATGEGFRIFLLVGEGAGERKLSQEVKGERRDNEESIGFGGSSCFKETSSWLAERGSFNSRARNFKRLI